MTSKYAERAKEISTKLEKYWVQDGIYLHGASAFLEGLMVETCEAVALEAEDANFKAGRAYEYARIKKTLGEKVSPKVAVLPSEDEKEAALFIECKKYAQAFDYSMDNRKVLDMNYDLGVGWDLAIASLKHKTLDELWPNEEELNTFILDFSDEDGIGCMPGQNEFFIWLKAFMRKRAQQ